ncbi:MAG TPA: L-rhamnose mutarotase [Candidatus Limnocylindria bacterium]|nr:L-rhamnose mutarotase [Candidatus Limnocylindria bacterium]
MERFAWKARILPGMLDEYVRRHDEIWPEMTRVLDEAGIRNYTIWTEGETLFGYYECDSVERAARVQAQSEVVDRWNAYMKDVMAMDIDPATGTAVQLRRVFLHAGVPPAN